MTVKELKELLNSFDENAVIVTDDYEAGYNDIHTVKLMRIALNVNKDHLTWRGPHDRPMKGEYPKPDNECVDAVLISCYEVMEEDEILAKMKSGG